MNTFGYFVDPITDIRLDFCKVAVEHLEGSKLSGVLKYIFWWVRTPNYRLLKDIVYVSKNGKRIRAPAGFIYNGGSVPFFLWWLYPPDQSECLAAFTIHDYDCTIQEDSSKECNQRLRDACRANGASWLKGFIIWSGVALFGPRFKGAKYG